MIPRANQKPNSAPLKRQQGLKLLSVAACLTASLAGEGCAPAGSRCNRHCDSETLVIAAVSMESKPRSTSENLARIEHWARQAADAGADLVLFPEAALSAWWASREVRQTGEPVDGPSIQHLIRLARELDIIIAVGMTETNGQKAHITHVLLDGSGIIGTHRKTDLASGEEKTWDPGNDANVFEIRKTGIGVAICYESVNPPTCAKLKANGAQIVLAPYANGTDPDELLTNRRPYAYARARENGLWYVACDATPHNKDRSLRRGAAYVINPHGELVGLTSADATGENMVVYPIPLGKEDGASRSIGEHTRCRH